MSLVFLPGFSAGASIIMTKNYGQKWRDATRSAAHILFFTIFLFGLQLKALILTIRKTRVEAFDQSMIQALIGN